MELDTGCHRFLTAQQEPDSAAGRQQQLLWSLIAAQPELQRLLLHHSKPHNYSIDQCVVKEQYWESVLQQLAGLTRLDMGRRLCSNSSDPVSSGVQQLTVAAPNLKHLRCIGIDSDCEDTWTLAWVGCYTSLTYLDIFFCSAGEIDFDVLGQLKQLRDLALHWYPDEYITTAQLSPLSGCTQLTHLKLDSLLMEQTQEAAAGGLLPTAAVIHAQVLPVTPPAWDGNTRSIGTTRLLQLTMLRKLVAGLMCKQPVAPFAPNLTHLRDVSGLSVVVGSSRHMSACLQWSLQLLYKLCSMRLPYVMTLDHDSIDGVSLCCYFHPIFIACSWIMIWERLSCPLASYQRQLVKVPQH